MQKVTDVFGRALMDWARGGAVPEIIERDHGFTDLSAGHDYTWRNSRTGRSRSGGPFAMSVVVSSMWAVAQGESACTSRSEDLMSLVWMLRLLPFGPPDCEAPKEHGVCRSMTCLRELTV